jgi:hypothetical protein
MSYTGYDHFGALEMKEFEGEAVVEYDGGPCNILQIVKNPGNGHYKWENIGNGIRPHVFPSFKEALKIQKRFGGEIIPADKV